MFSKPITEDDPLFKRVLSISHHVPTAAEKNNLKEIIETVREDLEQQILNKIKTAKIISKVGVNPETYETTVVFNQWFIDWLNEIHGIELNVTLEK